MVRESLRLIAEAIVDINMSTRTVQAGREIYDFASQIGGGPSASELDRLRLRDLIADVVLSSINTGATDSEALSAAASAAKAFAAGLAAFNVPTPAHPQAPEPP